MLTHHYVIRAVSASNTSVLLLYLLRAIVGWLVTQGFRGFSLNPNPKPHTTHLYTTFARPLHGLTRTLPASFTRLLGSEILDVFTRVYPRVFTRARGKAMTLLGNLLLPAASRLSISDMHWLHTVLAVLRRQRWHEQGLA